MGKGQSVGKPAQQGLDVFVAALRRQLAEPERVVRAFDVGGSGVKTALFSATALRQVIRFDGATNDEAEHSELHWTEPPSTLGEAPGERGFSSWLLKELPNLNREICDPNVCFGVSVGGDVDHSSGNLKNWWPGGGHPRQWGVGRPNPHVADLMGLPRNRTFVLHDGEAHLLGCSRCATPPPDLGCLALGTGVGFGLSDSSGAVVDSSSHRGKRSYLLNGVPISGARYKGIWMDWLGCPGGSEDAVHDVMTKSFANMVFDPWKMPWVSLVLGRRGMELAEAAHGCPAPSHNRPASNAEAVLAECIREPAVRAYGEQWLHFLHTEFIPQFTGTDRRHLVKNMCFAGGVAEANWPILSQVLVEPGGAGELRGFGRGGCASMEVDAAGKRLRVLPLAPRGSGLIGAGMYALAGMGGGAMGIWAS